MQVDSAKGLFERPAHTFVGHFIGSPGMNFVEAHHAQGQLTIAGIPVIPPANFTTQGDMKLGIRPEHLKIGLANATGTVPAQVKRVQLLGSYALVTCTLQAHEVRLRMATDQQMPRIGAQIHLEILSPQTSVYKNEVWVT
jgi:glycerol transport system ATP-binding protein